MINTEDGSPAPDTQPFEAARTPKERKRIVPKIEFKRTAKLSRQEVAERLLEWGHALAAGSEVELESGGDSLKIAVGEEIEWELEIEVDGDETEVEIELKWRDRPARSSTPTDAATETPAAEDEAKPDPAAETTPEPTRPPARRGRPRKAAAS